MVTLFSVSLFVNAFLLFWIEPLVTKILLPVFGGTPSVWTTAVLFFQLLILLGYLYTHLISTHLPFIWQWGLQSIWILLAILFSPQTIDSAIMHSGNFHADSIFLLLGLLFKYIGIPFFTIATFSTLLQKWFALSSHSRASDPYFLYAASNAGSLAALLAFPFILEPLLTSGNQLYLWRFGLGGLLLFTLYLGLQKKDWKVKKVKKISKKDHPKPNQLFLWILWAFIPSGMMLAVTTLLSVDLVSFPLLWILPLSIFLLTFIITFSKRFVWTWFRFRKYFIIISIIALFIWLTGIERPLWLIISVFLLYLFITSILFHKRLADHRPLEKHLTHFYLCIALGGFLGGLFNGLLAPLCFNRVQEFSVLFILAFLALVKNYEEIKIFFTKKKWIPALGIGILALALVYISHWVNLTPLSLWMVIIFGIPITLSLLLERSAIGMALALTIIMFSSQFFISFWGKTLERRRNFFGTLSIVRDAQMQSLKLFHGSTQHGIQFQNSELKKIPFAYYHPSGPCGPLFKSIRLLGPKSQRIGIIGLGIGSLITYSKPNDEWHFYEIDPDVIDIATNGDYFSYWNESTVSKQIISGDGRITLDQAHSQYYDLLVIDAFNSDAIPIHLLTKEAFRLYYRKLKPDGILAIHITNKYLDLLPQLCHQAAVVNRNLVFLSDTDDSIQGKFLSRWVVLGKDDFWKQMLPLPKGLQCYKMPNITNPNPWTDDWSNLVSAIRWFQ